MNLVDAIKEYAFRLKTDKALLSYLDTEDMVARFDACVHVEDVTEEWICRFGEFAGRKHVGNVRRVIYFCNTSANEKI
jgi:hypothetical protein